MEGGFRDTQSAQSAHLVAFYGWLPPELRFLPGIRWEALSREILVYCVNTIGARAEGGAIVLAVGAASGKVGRATLWGYATKLSRLLQDMRERGAMGETADLSSASAWLRYVQQTSPTSTRLKLLAAYSALALHQRTFLEGLMPDRQQALVPFTLPAMPAHFLREHGQRDALLLQGHASQREKSSAIADLYYPLLALLDLRCQAVKQLLAAYRAACAEGDAPLPREIDCTVSLPALVGDPGQHGTLRLDVSATQLNFVLWNRSSWVRTHAERYSQSVCYDASRRRGAYAPEKDGFFLQWQGPGDAVLWFGDLLRGELLQHLANADGAAADAQARKNLGRSLGAGNGFATSRPGLLNPTRGWNLWFASLRLLSGELLFEPQALCRGVLYGAALAFLALTSGLGVSELLQISQERRLTTTALTELLGEGAAGQLLLHLLPRGARSEEGRRYFLISQQAQALLTEIRHELTAAHGSIPAVFPDSRGAKSDFLPRERYVFPWAAGDNHQGILLENDAVVLMRFVLHGIAPLKLRGGEPVHVDSHLMRSALAFVLREYGLPLDALAWTLHLEAERNARLTPVLSDAFPPQSRETLKRHLLLLHRFHQHVQERLGLLEREALGRLDVARDAAKAPERSQGASALLQPVIDRDRLAYLAQKSGLELREGDVRLALQLCLGGPGRDSPESDTDNGLLSQRIYPFLRKLLPDRSNMRSPAGALAALLELAVIRYV